jgi:hypothetical protein
MYEIESPYAPSPYTSACDQLLNQANANGSGDIIMTNLFRCALFNDERPESRSPLEASTQELRQILDWQRGCLTEEITTLTPTAVVFFTGPFYDDVLRDEFKGADPGRVFS